MSSDKTQQPNNISATSAPINTPNLPSQGVNFSDTIPSQSLGAKIKFAFRKMGLNFSKSGSFKIIMLFIVLPVFLIGIVLFLYFFVLGTGNRGGTDAKISDAYELLKSQNTLKLAEGAYSFFYPNAIAVRDRPSPLNGVFFSKEEFASFSQTKPLAVMINNHTEARPQSGLTSADIVYETLAEGGITRMLAIFWSNNPVQIGPIRSFRTYFGDMAFDNDAYVYHIGQSAVDESKIRQFPEGSILDSTKYFQVTGLQHSSCGFYRDQDKIDKGIAIEHTAYTDITRIRECVPGSVWNKAPSITSWQFKPDIALSERPINSEANITFSGGADGSSYSTRWLYDRTTNSYKRYQQDKPSIDKNNSAQISSKNLVIMEANILAYSQAEGRLTIGLIGQGKATFMFDGKVTVGTWRKDTRTTRTRFLDGNGKEIVFNRGQFWISIVGDSKSQSSSKYTVK